ncbi:hypothetical protein HK101_007977 [Irineochytrium annulatum]|nr:hypothetical protein HK101_007977 [Irineochytrium annulatum]
MIAGVKLRSAVIPFKRFYVAAASNPALNARRQNRNPPVPMPPKNPQEVASRGRHPPRRGRRVFKNDDGSEEWLCKGARKSKQKPEWVKALLSEQKAERLAEKGGFDEKGCAGQSRNRWTSESMGQSATAALKLADKRNEGYPGKGLRDTSNVRDTRQVTPRGARRKPWEIELWSRKARMWDEPRPAHQRETEGSSAHANLKPGDATLTKRGQLTVKEAAPSPPELEEPSRIPTTRDGRPVLLGLPKAKLKSVLEGKFETSYRLTQLWEGIYKTGLTTFDDMTVLPKSDRGMLRSTFELGLGRVKSKLVAQDGTTKFLLNYFDGDSVETVLIPSLRGETLDEDEHDLGPAESSGKTSTLCISSQVGCSLTCTFCHTGTQKLMRNLTAGEILAQLLLGLREAGDFPLNAATPRRLTNVVLMGQGEPLLNARNVFSALRTFTREMGFSPRRVTLSTSGVAPMIPRVGRELGVSLALSLHAATDELRDVLVPLNKQYPIAELVKAVLEYGNTVAGSPQRRRVTIEYCMLRGVNDDPAMARELLRTWRGSPVRFNLIPFNAWPGSGYERSTPEVVTAFQKVLMDGGFVCKVRHTRGSDVMAACGQLRSSEVFKAKVAVARASGEGGRARIGGST